MLLTLLCIYLAAWRVTATSGVVAAIHATYGTEDFEIDTADFDPWVPMPLIVRLDEPHWVGLNSVQFVRRYYVWYGFGACRLPFQAPDPPGPEVG